MEVQSCCKASLKNRSTLNAKRLALLEKESSDVTKEEVEWPIMRM